MKRFLKIELCFDGSSYAGWQVQKKQPQVRTVQGEIEAALERIVGVKVPVCGSGRTDAGVHALYQVAGFILEQCSLPPETLTSALNAFLPPDIRIFRTEEVSESFHPIRDVFRKRYRYLFSDSRPFPPHWRGYVWASTKPLDLALMREAAKYLVGTHDFSAFQTVGSPRRSTVRTITDLTLNEGKAEEPWTVPAQYVSRSFHNSPLPLLPSPSWIKLEVEADGFLYNMVRAIAGTLYLFGRHHRDFDAPEKMKTVLESCSRAFAGPTAPPYGLYMIDVIYSKEGITENN